MVFLDGGLNFNGVVPITGATGTYSVPVLSYSHAFNFFRRSANLTASLPYAVGTFSGEVLGTQRSVYRSTSSRLAGTVALRFGGNCQNLQVAWQYS